MHVLIVDDSPTIRRMVRASLGGMTPGLQISEAGSGLEAIEKVALSATDLMILDLNMPDMHGLEVLDFMRGHQRYRHVPILVLTTRGDDDARDGALRRGATSFMTKPFTPIALVTEAKRLVAGRAPAPGGE